MHTKVSLIAGAALAAAMQFSHCALAQQRTVSMENAPGAGVSAATRITANVVNRSQKDATSGTVVFDNASASCSITFGVIRALGGSATDSCMLSGPALTVKATFTASDGTKWVGIAGDGQPFDFIDMNLNDQR